MNIRPRIMINAFRHLPAPWLALILLAAGLRPVFADSYYSSIGLGLPKYLVTTKAAGMGGAGIAVLDRLALNSLNPAAINIQGMTTLGVNMEYEMAHNESGLGSANTRYGNAMGMQFIVPVKKELLFMTMLRPLTGSRYTLSFASTDTALAYTRTLNGNGGVSSAALGLQYNYRGWLAVAAMADLHFGAFNEKWDYDFVDAEFRDGTDEFNSHLYGVGYDLSAWWRINERFAVGGLYRSGSRLNMETSVDLANGVKISADSNKIDIDYPAALGFGAALTLKKWLFAADFYRQGWEKYRLDGAAGGLKPYTRLSAGIEYRDSRTALDRYRRRIGWRLGGYYAELPFANGAGETVHETFLTLGVGLPFPVTVGQVDLAVEVGRRGDVERFMYKDTIIRISGSLVGSERWFQRRY